MARWQYQQRAEPLVEIVTSDKWAPMCPSRIIVRALCLTAAIVAGSCFLDTTPIITSELVTCDKWTPTYPVKFNQSKRIQFTDFTIGSFDYPTLDKWYSQYPNRLDKLKQFQPLGWFAGSCFLDVTPIITIDNWQGSYPSRLNRITRVQSLDFTIFSNELVTCDKWIPTYPNRFNSLKNYQPLGWFDTKLYWFSGSEVITLDKWISNYPDRLDRIKRILWLDWSMVDSYFSHIPISTTMLYFRRYLDDPLG